MRNVSSATVVLLKFFALQNKEYITLRDLKRCKLAANVFNLLFSIDKFIDADPRRPQVVQEVFDLSSVFPGLFVMKWNTLS